MNKFRSFDWWTLTEKHSSKHIRSQFNSCIMLLLCLFSFLQITIKQNMDHLSPPPSPTTNSTTESKLLNYPKIMNGLDKLHVTMSPSSLIQRANLNTALKLNRGKWTCYFGNTIAKDWIAIDNLKWKSFGWPVNFFRFLSSSPQIYRCCTIHWSIPIPSSGRRHFCCPTKMQRQQLPLVW